MLRLETNKLFYIHQFYNHFYTWLVNFYTFQKHGLKLLLWTLCYYGHCSQIESLHKILIPNRYFDRDS